MLVNRLRQKSRIPQNAGNIRTATVQNADYMIISVTKMLFRSHINVTLLCYNTISISEDIIYTLYLYGMIYCKI